MDPRHCAQQASWSVTELSGQSLLPLHEGECLSGAPVPQRVNCACHPAPKHRSGELIFGCCFWMGIPRSQGCPFEYVWIVPSKGWKQRSFEPPMILYGSLQAKTIKHNKNQDKQYTVPTRPGFHQTYLWQFPVDFVASPWTKMQICCPAGSKRTWPGHLRAGYLPKKFREKHLHDVLLNQ